MEGHRRPSRSFKPGVADVYCVRVKCRSLAFPPLTIPPRSIVVYKLPPPHLFFTHPAAVIHLKIASIMSFGIVWAAARDGSMEAAATAAAGGASKASASTTAAAAEAKITRVSNAKRAKQGEDEIETCQMKWMTCFYISFSTRFNKRRSGGNDEGGDAAFIIKKGKFAVECGRRQKRAAK